MEAGSLPSGSYVNAWVRMEADMLFDVAAGLLIGACGERNRRRRSEREREVLFKVRVVIVLASFGVLCASCDNIFILREKKNKNSQK